MRFIEPRCEGSPRRQGPGKEPSRENGSLKRGLNLQEALTKQESRAAVHRKPHLHHLSCTPGDARADTTPRRRAFENGSFVFLTCLSRKRPKGSSFLGVPEPA